MRIGLLLAGAVVACDSRPTGAHAAYREAEARAVAALHARNPEPRPPSESARRDAELAAARVHDAAEAAARARFQAMSPAEHLAAARTPPLDQALRHLRAIPREAPEFRAARRMIPRYEVEDRRGVARGLAEIFERRGIPAARVEARGREARQLYIESIRCSGPFLASLLREPGEDLRARGFTTVRCDNGFTLYWDQRL